jgi:hypothetical protein
MRVTIIFTLVQVFTEVGWAWSLKSLPRTSHKAEFS